MSILFYPHQEDINSNLSVREKLELMREAAERYKSMILQISPKPVDITVEKKLTIPRDTAHAYNWDELAKLLHQLRELPENNAVSRIAKAEFLIKLAEIYETLRGAKMPKLEAVRLALMNEATHLKSAANNGAA